MYKNHFVAVVLAGCCVLFACQSCHAPCRHRGLFSASSSGISPSLHMALPAIEHGRWFIVHKRRTSGFEMLLAKSRPSLAESKLMRMLLVESIFEEATCTLTSRAGKVVAFVNIAVEPAPMGDLANYDTSLWVAKNYPHIEYFCLSLTGPHIEDIVAFTIHSKAGSITVNAADIHEVSLPN